MKGRKDRFAAADVKILDRRTRYKGFFEIEEFQVTHRLFRGGWSKTLKRELFCRGRAVGVLLFDPERDLVVLCEQFRIGALAQEAGPWQLELVAGMVEPGESLAEVALRESAEEAGCVPTQLIPIVDYLVSPGGTNEEMSIYLGIVVASNLTPYHGVVGEGEDIRLVETTRSDAMEMVADGQINNAATIIALQWLELNKARIVELVNL